LRRRLLQVAPFQNNDLAGTDYGALIVGRNVAKKPTVWSLKYRNLRGTVCMLDRKQGCQPTQP
jgi:hypothetical protein